MCVTDALQELSYVQNYCHDDCKYIASPHCVLLELLQELSFVQNSSYNHCTEMTSHQCVLCKTLVTIIALK